MAFIGNVYSVSFSAVSATAGSTKDLFDIVASTSMRFKVGYVSIYKSTIGSTEGMNISLWRGSSVPSSGGAANTPTALDTRSLSTATFTAVTNAAIPGSSGTGAKLLFAGVLNDYAPFVYLPVYDENRDDRPIIGTLGSSAGLGERFQVRMASPAAAITLSGTIIIEEIGLT